MEPWLQTIITIVGSILASSGFWAFMQERTMRKAAENRYNSAESKILIGLAHDKIVELGIKYIELGDITEDEYENLHDYLYFPYSALGGNGSAKRIMHDVDKLPIRKTAR